MKYTFLILVVLLGLIACKPGASTTEAPKPMDNKALEDSLMTIHDTAMVKLNQIQQLSSALRTIKSNVQETQEGKLVSPPGLDENLERLKLADQGMWDWMKSYHDMQDSIPPDQLEAYLKNQMLLIQSVNTGIDNSIKQAKEWLEANGEKK